MKRENLSRYGILYLAFIIYSLSAVCAKAAAGKDSISGMMVFLGLEIVCLGGYAFVWQQALKRFSLVTAMANKGIVVIMNLFWSVILFGEEITVYNIIGALVIIGGIWVVSSDG